MGIARFPVRLLVPAAAAIMVVIPIAAITAAPVFDAALGTPTPTPYYRTVESVWYVSATEDDAFQNDVGGGFDNWNAEINVVSGAVAAGRMNTGLRFDNLDIPQGATINTAAISVYSNISGRMWATIKGIDVNDFQPMISTLIYPWTSVEVLWQSANFGVGYQESPDIKTHILKYMNKPGRERGDAIGFVLDGIEGTNYVFVGAAYDGGDPDKYAKLTINYTYWCDWRAC